MIAYHTQMVIFFTLKYSMILRKFKWNPKSWTVLIIVFCRRSNSVLFHFRGGDKLKSSRQRFGTLTSVPGMSRFPWLVSSIIIYALFVFFRIGNWSAYWKGCRKIWKFLTPAVRGQYKRFCVLFAVRFGCFMVCKILIFASRGPLFLERHV